MPTKEDKLKAVNYFLNKVLNAEFPLSERKQEMIRVGKKVCRGFPEWSDYWGMALKPIDDIYFQELLELLNLV